MNKALRADAFWARTDHLSEMVEQTVRWSSMNSGTGNIDGLSRLTDELAAAFSCLPGGVELVEPASVFALDGLGREISVQNGRHLVIRVRPEARSRVLLTGHMDTVFPIGHSFQQCAWLDERRLRGPGVLDMKSGLAIMLTGLRAFEETRPALGYDVVINSDEETGSLASAALIRELAAGKRAALTYEPTMPGGMIARARPGSGNYAALFKGRSAHAGRNPEEGRNAVVAAADLALRLARGRRRDLAINPARIEGGSPNNVVPDTAVLRFNLRPKAPHQHTEAAELVSRLSDEVASEHDVDVRIHGGMGRPPKPVDAATERLFELVAAASRELGTDLDWVDSGGVCDGNNIAACGVPVLDTMGAVGEFIHSPDEYLDTHSLVPKARLTEMVLRRLDEDNSHL